MRAGDYTDYGFASVKPSHMYERISRAVFRLCGPIAAGTRVLDIGCGAGVLSDAFQRRGCQVVGVDLSETGIEVAKRHFPTCRFELLGVNEATLELLRESPFDIVVSTEVIEHLYAPKQLAKSAFDVLRPGGQFIVTTPYHGFCKNLAISLFNQWDVHADPLWDGGHIKLFSRRTLQRLMVETGFTNLRFSGIGRVPYLWMSMAIAGIKAGVR